MSSAAKPITSPRAPLLVPPAPPPIPGGLALPTSRVPHVASQHGPSPSTTRSSSSSGSERASAPAALSVPPPPPRVPPAPRGGAAAPPPPPPSSSSALPTVPSPPPLISQSAPPAPSTLTSPAPAAAPPPSPVPPLTQLLGASPAVPPNAPRASENSVSVADAGRLTLPLTHATLERAEKTASSTANTFPKSPTAAGKDGLRVVPSPPLSPRQRSTPSHSPTCSSSNSLMGLAGGLVEFAKDKGGSILTHKAARPHGATATSSSRGNSPEKNLFNASLSLSSRQSVVSFVMPADMDGDVVSGKEKEGAEGRAGRVPRDAVSGNGEPSGSGRVVVRPAKASPHSALVAPSRAGHAGGRGGGGGGVGGRVGGPGSHAQTSPPSFRDRIQQGRATSRKPTAIRRRNKDAARGGAPQRRGFGNNAKRGSRRSSRAVSPNMSSCSLALPPASRFAIVGLVGYFHVKMLAVVQRQRATAHFLAVTGPRAAFIIQCCWRRYRQRQRLRPYLAVCFLQPWIRFKMSQLRRKKEESARLLQRVFRGEQTRSLMRFLFAQMKRNRALQVVNRHIMRWEAQITLRQLKLQRDERNVLLGKCHREKLHLLRSERAEFLALTRRGADVLGIRPFVAQVDYVEEVTALTGVAPVLIRAIGEGSRMSMASEESVMLSRRQLSGGLPFPGELSHSSGGTNTAQVLSPIQFWYGPAMRLPKSRHFHDDLLHSSTNSNSQANSPPNSCGTPHSFSAEFKRRLSATAGESGPAHAKNGTAVPGGASGGESRSISAGGQDADGGGGAGGAAGSTHGDSESRGQAAHSSGANTGWSLLHPSGRLTAAPSAVVATAQAWQFLEGLFCAEGVQYLDDILAAKRSPFVISDVVGDADGDGLDTGTGDKQPLPLAPANHGVLVKVLDTGAGGDGTSPHRCQQGEDAGGVRQPRRQQQQQQATVAAIAEARSTDCPVSDGYAKGPHEGHVSGSSHASGQGKACDSVDDSERDTGPLGRTSNTPAGPSSASTNTASENALALLPLLFEAVAGTAVAFPGPTATAGPTSLSSAQWPTASVDSAAAAVGGAVAGVASSGSSSTASAGPIGVPRPPCPPGRVGGTPATGRPAAPPPPPPPLSMKATTTASGPRLTVVPLPSPLAIPAAAATSLEQQQQQQQQQASRPTASVDTAIPSASVLPAVEIAAMSPRRRGGHEAAVLLDEEEAHSSSPIGGSAGPLTSSDARQYRKESSDGLVTADRKAEGGEEKETDNSAKEAEPRALDGGDMSVRSSALHISIGKSVSRYRSSATTVSSGLDSVAAAAYEARIEEQNHMVRDGVLAAYVDLLCRAESIERRTLEQELLVEHADFIQPVQLVSYAIHLSRSHHVAPFYAPLLLSFNDSLCMRLAAKLFVDEQEQRMALLEEYDALPLEHLSRPVFSTTAEARRRALVCLVAAAADPFPKAEEEEVRHFSRVMRAITTQQNGKEGPHLQLHQSVDAGEMRSSRRTSTVPTPAPADQQQQAQQQRLSEGGARARKHRPFTVHMIPLSTNNEVFPGENEEKLANTDVVPGTSAAVASPRSPLPTLSRSVPRRHRRGQPIPLLRSLDPHIAAASRHHRHAELPLPRQPTPPPPPPPPPQQQQQQQAVHTQLSAARNSSEPSHALTQPVAPLRSATWAPSQMEVYGRPPQRQPCAATLNFSAGSVLWEGAPGRSTPLRSWVGTPSSGNTGATLSLSNSPASPHPLSHPQPPPHQPQQSDPFSRPRFHAGSTSSTSASFLDGAGWQRRAKQSLSERSFSRNSLATTATTPADPPLSVHAAAPFEESAAGRVAAAPQLSPLVRCGDEEGEDRHGANAHHSGLTGPRGGAGGSPTAPHQRDGGAAQRADVSVASSDDLPVLLQREHDLHPAPSSKAGGQVVPPALAARGPPPPPPPRRCHGTSAMATGESSIVGGDVKEAPADGEEERDAQLPWSLPVASDVQDIASRLPTVPRTPFNVR